MLAVLLLSAVLQQASKAFASDADVALASLRKRLRDANIRVHM
jgi:hypothetical protein